MDGRVLLPANQFVLKVHSRCDLACDHCYVYESADQSWRGRPMVIPPDVVSRAAMRVAEHVKTHEMDRVEVVLHGGEPLLAGVAGLRAILGQLTETLNGVCHLDVKLHTNGVLLSEEFCELLAEHGVGVGISLDGDRAANDRHRRYRNGGSSYDAAIRAIRLLTDDRFRHLYAGLLCTIDVANDPVRVYESLLEFDPPRVDFLLPHATWDTPPPRPTGSGTEYADWLIPVFDRWQGDGYPVRIRTFDSIAATLAGGESSTEALGLSPVRMVVIETDGTYEQADSLKVAYDGAPATGLDVFTHSLDAVLEHPGVAARQHGMAELSAACQRCPVVASCGGGMYVHRYRSGSGFDNPSVYCDDLFKLVSHIKDRLPHLAGATHGVSHAVSEAALRELAVGRGGAAAIGELKQAQQSMHRGLLTAVYQQSMAASAIPQSAKQPLRAAWRALAAVEAVTPDALDAVLGHPYLRIWAVRCIEGLSGVRADSAAGLVADVWQLAGIAAAAVIRGQARARVEVPALAGVVHLPGLGRLVTDAPAEAAIVEVDADWVRVRLGVDGWRLPRPCLLAGEDCAAEPCAPDGTPETAVSAAAAWQPVRMLSAPGIRVALADADPYRDGRQWTAMPHVPDGGFAQWQGSFELAWQEITRHHAAYAPSLAAGLTAIMPLSLAAAESGTNSAVRHEFSAIGAALPGDPVALALQLIREFQHAKFGAILDLFDLFESATSPADPRPHEASLRDAYAQLAVCDFWRARASLAMHDSEQAVTEYMRWHRATTEAVEALASCGSLTPFGVSFIDQMRTALAPIG